MNEYIQVIILALIQGAAELLPVSSSAHVIFAERLMGLDPAEPRMTFLLVMLHTGTMFAVIVYFWPRWRGLLIRAEGDAVSGAVSKYHFVKLIVLATGFTGVLGLGLKFLIEQVILPRLLEQEQGEVEQLFKNLPLIAAALFLVGLFIIVAGSFESKAKTQGLTTRTAILIGIVQGLCLPFRGFSRSGATISTALLRGVRRPLAEDFSFALAVVLTPPVIVDQLRRLLKREDWNSHEQLIQLLGPGLMGMVFSFLAGLLALKVLSAVLENGRWAYFGYYCILASGVIYCASIAGY